MRIAAVLLLLFATPQKESLTPRDLAVWQPTLSWLQHDRGDFQLIGETTSGINLGDWKFGDKAPKIPQAAVDDSQRRNAIIIEYETDPKVAGVTFLPREKWNGADWKSATVKLSLPGYTKDGETAIVLATHSVGDRNLSIFFLLKNVKGSWKVAWTHAQPFYVIVG